MRLSFAARAVGLVIICIPVLATSSDGCRLQKTATSPETPTGVAATVLAAKDMTSTEDALNAVWRLLGVGLYTADATPIIVGAEQDLNDFYVYEFERDVIAQALVDNEHVSVMNVAVLLETIGVGNQVTGEAFTPPELMALISNAIGRSRSDTSAMAKGYQLIDALAKGNNPPVDLGQANLDPGTTYLDPVQYFAVLYDLLGGAQTQALTASRHLATVFRVDAYASQAVYVKVAPRPLTLLDKAILDLGMRVTVLPNEPVSTHWLHDPTDLSPGVNVSVDVRFKNPGLSTAKAGRLKDVGLPPNGPFPGCTVVMDSNEDPVLTENGDMANGITTTDSQGSTIDSYVPDLEKRPGDGEVITETGWLPIAIEPPPPWQGWSKRLRIGPISVSRHRNLNLIISGWFDWRNHDQVGWIHFNPQVIPLHLSPPETVVYSGSVTLTTDGVSCPYFLGSSSCSATIETTSNLHLLVGHEATGNLQLVIDGSGSLSCDDTCQGKQEIQLPWPVISHEWPDISIGGTTDAWVWQGEGWSFQNTKIALSIYEPGSGEPVIPSIPNKLCN